jgi:hypothetical protein
MAFELGSRVEVKFAGDKRRICRVVKAQRKVVYITSDALYERAKAQGTKVQKPPQASASGPESNTSRSLRRDASGPVPMAPHGLHNDLASRRT